MVDLIAAALAFPSVWLLAMILQTVLARRLRLIGRNGHPGEMGAFIIMCFLSCLVGAVASVAIYLNI